MGIVLAAAPFPISLAADHRGIVSHVPDRKMVKNMKQTLNLTSIGNARELGGYRTADGRTVKHCVLLRTSALASLSQEDRNTLETRYHVAVVADFRMSAERRHSPDPVLSGADNLHLSVMELEDYPGYTPELAKLLSDPNANRFELIRIGYEMGTLSDHLYVDFLFSERGKQAYRTFFQRLLSLPEDRAILWHCTDGKDRTGIAAMLILTALGVDRDTILEDYLLTNEYNAEKLKKVRVGLEHAPLSPELKELALFGAGAVMEQFMTNALDAMDERCGSPEGYLEQVLGVGAAEREALRLRFLE